MTSLAELNEAKPYLSRKSKTGARTALNQTPNVTRLSTRGSLPARAPPKTTTKQQTTPETRVSPSNPLSVVPRSPVKNCTINVVTSKLLSEPLKADRSDKPLGIERCQNIVQEILAFSGVEHYVLSGLSADDAAYIMDTIREEDAFRKRVTFLPLEGELTVKMPTDAHEAVLAPLTYACTKAIYEMGHDNAVVQVHISGNTRFLGDHITSDPDMHIRVSSTLSHTSSEPKSLMMVEVGFTQGEIPVIGKLNYYTIDSQDLESASSFHVSEGRPYSCPADDTEIAKRSRFSPLKSYDEWKPKRTKKNAFGPVIVDGHTWIDISRVDIHAWIRTSPTTRINVNQRKAGYAYGSIYPEFDVDDVDKLFSAALKRISQKILSYYEEHIEGTHRAREASSTGFTKKDGGWQATEESGLDVETDHNDIVPSASFVNHSDEEVDEEPNEVDLAATVAALCDWEPKLPIVNWRELRSALITGIWNTGYSRYKSWHESMNKRDRQEAFDDQEYGDQGHRDEKPHMTRGMSKRLRIGA